MKTYLIMAVVAMVIGAYWAGATISYHKCQTDAGATKIQMLDEITNNKRIINEKVFNTSGGDIRQFLRQKYTITE
ncbi:MAG: hypothetical protein K5912_01155 [Alphaproteobacteria bacterium]|nr:hypothetical protein [Alphaproteobacteria bacterium]